MSAPPKFATLPDAIAAYLAGRSRRWAEVDGWQIDLLQAATEEGRVREEPSMIPPHDPIAFHLSIGGSRYTWDREVAEAVALDLALAHEAGVSRAELARASEVLPELAVPSEAARDVECCRACGRPMIGEVKP